MCICASVRDDVRVCEMMFECDLASRVECL